MAVPQEVLDYFTTGRGAGGGNFFDLMQGGDPNIYRDANGQYWRAQWEGGSPVSDSSDGGSPYISDIRTTTPTGVKLGVSEDIYGLDGSSRGSYTPKKEVGPLAGDLLKFAAVATGIGAGLGALGFTNGLGFSGAAGAGGFVPSGAINAGFSPAADGLLGAGLSEGAAAAGAGGLDLGGGLFMGADGAITGALPASPSALSNAGILESVGAGSLNGMGGSGLLSNLGKVSATDALKLGGLLAGAGGAGGTQGGSGGAPQLPYSGTQYNMPGVTQATTPDGLLSPATGNRSSGGWRYRPSSSDTIRGLLG